MLFDVLQEKIKKLEKRVSDLEKSQQNKALKLTFYKRYFNSEKKIFFYDTYNVEQIKKELNINSVFECFKKNNNDLHCSYYIDGITNIRHLVISDTYEKLQDDIIDIGRCE